MLKRTRRRRRSVRLQVAVYAVTAGIHTQGAYALSAPWKKKLPRSLRANGLKMLVSSLPARSRLLLQAFEHGKYIRIWLPYGTLARIVVALRSSNANGNTNGNRQWNAPAGSREARYQWKYVVKLAHFLRVTFARRETRDLTGKHDPKSQFVPCLRMISFDDKI